MNKDEREVRRILRGYPTIKLETDASGFMLIAPSGKRRRLGSLRGKERAMKNVELWCQTNSGARSPQGGVG